MNTVVVLQSNYIPWKGYFDLIHDADVFIFYDDVQYTKNDWRNRNKVKRPKGLGWLTIPTGTNLNRMICEVTLNDPDWAIRHWTIIRDSYSKAPHFDRYKDFFEHVYLGTKWWSLSELNQFLIKHIASQFLGITTAFKDSREYSATGQKLDRLIDLVKQAKADIYISGPSAKNYIDEIRFRKAGVTLKFKSYSGYPEYSQFYPPFEHAVSILDLLFQVGPDAPYFIWGWRQNNPDLALSKV